MLVVSFSTHLWDSMLHGMPDWVVLKGMLLELFQRSSIV